MFLDTNNRLFIPMPNYSMGQSGLVIINTATDTISNTITLPVGCEFIAAGIHVNTIYDRAYMNLYNSSVNNSTNKLISIDITDSISNGNVGVIAKSISTIAPRFGLISNGSKLIVGGGGYDDYLVSYTDIGPFI